MISKLIKTAAMIIILPNSVIYAPRGASAQTINQSVYTNWINSPYYSSDNKSRGNVSVMNFSWMDKEIENDIKRNELMSRTNSIPKIEKSDFGILAEKARRPYVEDKVGQTYYQLEDFKDDLTSEVNKRLKGVGMKAKIDLKKVSLRLWEQRATQRYIDFSRPSTLYYGFDKKLEAESKYGSRYCIYFTLTGHFDDFRQLFGFGKE
jgi:hypothetical protein